jgi:hypothetical protein
VATQLDIRDLGAFFNIDDAKGRPSTRAVANVRVPGSGIVANVVRVIPENHLVENLERLRVIDIN